LKSKKIMAEDFPSNFDVIVIGTGLTESIIAAAASRIGKQVLHIDHRDYYGGNWASFSFSNLQSVLDPQTVCQSVVDPQIGDESAPSGLVDKDLTLRSNFTSFTNVEQQWNIVVFEEVPAENDNPESETQSPPNHKKVWTKEEILKESRKFNFDLSPKVLFSRGEMVEVLISSGISRYAEFKNVPNIFSYEANESKLVRVPCSRADVFSSKEVTMIEKRLLMRTMTACVDFEKNPETLKAYEEKTFGDFLTANQIQGKIRQFILETVAMAEETTPCPAAIEKVRKFVTSIGRFGNTPFLWTLYGTGELPQCFCRCSAVFGGIYCLKRQTHSIALDADGQAIGIYSQDQLLKSSFIVLEESLNPKSAIKSGISRAILLTDKALVDEHQPSLINFPSIGGKNAVRILELPASAMACPRGLFVVHLITPQGTTAVEDLEHVLTALFKSDVTQRPNVLWSLHFNVHQYENPEAGSLPSNVFTTAGPNSILDLDDNVLQAKKVFLSMFPGEEFLPRVPDPEDVITEDMEEFPPEAADEEPSNQAETETAAISNPPSSDQ